MRSLRLTGQLDLFSLFMTPTGQGSYQSVERSLLQVQSLLSLGWCSSDHIEHSLYPNPSCRVDAKELNFALICPKPQLQAFLNYLHVHRQI
ncbi:hypothetical protein GOODEAATRI_032636 [Goodea atripinnis]|uniref:Uncharacterized protein n=1 Tax=Goodea atripinnis TaxID=208336 RepID=A0ABV0Q2X7_9TELE